ncbi:hypothetical protein AQUCO_03000348v1 [Aquilegia coerulea]|uniref:Uncharacterized protein n=1 Tax=Aquilegia coerulea TaxID=218851 RepID=A0A2G5D2K5_AQUCA|nr:hypothetical protein AQUCO_03000348v1 [Aquilegia coerulea]
MMIKRFFRSNLTSQVSAGVRRAVASESYNKGNFNQNPAAFARWNSNSTEATQQKDAKGFKGHDMLAPFTAGNQATDPGPLVIEKSEGCYIYDTNGKKYLDGLAGLWVSPVISTPWLNSSSGSEPRLVEAATRQMNTLPFYHSFWNRTTKISLDLATELLETFTARKMGKVFFTSSGSEANDTQVKLVWYYNNALGRPEKKKIISRKKSYHGSTLVSASLTGLPILHQKFDLPLPFVLHTDCPHYWRYHLPGETEEDYATRLANNLEDLILKEGPETIAAFIAEPVMGAGGVLLPPATYFEKVHAVLKKYDILLIMDEVICGFGRLGTMFGCDKYNIKPDLVSLAKAFSSGYMPIGAVLVSPEISDVINSQSSNIGSFGHGFTFSGHPVACAVALEAIKIYKERNIVKRVQSLSPKFVDGIKAFSNSPIIGEHLLFEFTLGLAVQIRGIGLTLGFEFVDNKSPNGIFPSEWGVGRIFWEECKKRGMLVSVAVDNINISPPLTITSEEIDEVIGICGKALKVTEEKVAELKSEQKQ